MTKEYKKTLNLPKTEFPLRANLGATEAQMQNMWKKLNIYQKIQNNNKNNQKYILHDGPPYPNGDIHLGHALNKVLKDIVVKYKSMQGFSAPYVPGWDCHGLPIETQLIKKIGDKRRELSVSEFRQKCKEYAMEFVDLQRTEFIRLGVFGEWNKPYLTTDHTYEEKIIELFGVLAEKKYIYRGLKPIHWCSECETALAEAEVEYEDERSPSIFVKFELIDPKNTAIKNVKEKINFVIWTTTPWTLPANVAIAAHPELDYVVVKTEQGVFVLAEGLLESFLNKLEIKEKSVLAKAKGAELEGVVCQHPFIDRKVQLVNDRYVTLEQGTGLVHIAPGHGAEDYLVGLKYKLPVIMPVNEKGYFDDTVPEFIRGKKYDVSNKLIGEKLKEDGLLLKLEFMKHSYPHCWRCKKPVIFRATEQWFIAVDHNNMRKEALEAIKNTKWFPAWGENRIRGMVETRPDWCISRQRSWGVPVPAFYCKKCKKPQMTGIFNQSIRKMIREYGTNGWFEKEASEILPKGTQCPDCGDTNFIKETDILDVWFESGSSHAAVLENLSDHTWPADLYLEGSDQHRGWFQTSLLLGIGYKGRAPFKSVLTHGFTIDEKGKKMSKSMGNVINPQDVVKEYGADILRLWVASTDFRNDMAASASILKQVREAYTKIRNTCRFLLSNLNEFTPDKVVAYDELLEIDKWILLRLHRLIERIARGYDRFEFHIVYHSLYDFCVNDLSAYYLDMSKDRLYCDGVDSVERRSCQTAMKEILSTLVVLMAPVLSFTAEDINHYLIDQSESVFFKAMPKVNPKYIDEKLEARWDKIIELKEKVYQKLEALRASKQISASLEAKVEIGSKGQEWIKDLVSILPMVFIVSQVEIIDGEEIIVAKADGSKCERCWNLRTSVGKDDAHLTLCERCARVVKAIK